MGVVRHEIECVVVLAGRNEVVVAARGTAFGREHDLLAEDLTQDCALGTAHQHVFACQRSLAVTVLLGQVAPHLATECFPVDDLVTIGAVQQLLHDSTSGGVEVGVLFQHEGAPSDCLEAPRRTLALHQIPVGSDVLFIDFIGEEHGGPVGDHQSPAQVHASRRALLTQLFGTLEHLQLAGGEAHRATLQPHALVPDVGVGAEEGGGGERLTGQKRSCGDPGTFVAQAAALATVGLVQCVEKLFPPVER